MDVVEGGSRLVRGLGFRHPPSPGGGIRPQRPLSPCTRANRASQVTHSLGSSAGMGIAELAGILFLLQSRFGVNRQVLSTHEGGDHWRGKQGDAANGIVAVLCIGVCSFLRVAISNGSI